MAIDYTNDTTDWSKIPPIYPKHPNPFTTTFTYGLLISLFSDKFPMDGREYDSDIVVRFNNEYREFTFRDFLERLGFDNDND